MSMKDNKMAPICVWMKVNDYVQFRCLPQSHNYLKLIKQTV